MRDITEPSRTPWTGLYWVWTATTVVVFAAVVTWFVTGVIEGWPVVGLVLLGIGVVILAGSVAIHVRLLRRRYARLSNAATGSAGGSR